MKLSISLKLDVSGVPRSSNYTCRPHVASWECQIDTTSNAAGVTERHFVCADATIVMANVSATMVICFSCCRSSA